MKRRGISHAEIVDVVLGGAEPDLEARVHHAARTGLRDGAAYDAWARAAQQVSDAVEPLRASCDQVNEAVMARVASMPVHPFEVLEADALPEPRRPWRVAAGALAAVLLLVLAAAGYTFLGGPRAVVRALEGEAWVQARNAEGRDAIANGDRYRFPVDISLGEGARLHLALPHETEVTLASTASVRFEAPRTARQTTGTVVYRVNQRGGSLADFTVQVPQGRIVDLGTEFEVTVREGAPTEIRILEGSVDVVPAAGAGVSASAGERALLTRARALKEATPEAADPAALARMAQQDDPRPDRVELVFQAEEAVLGTKDGLLALLRPQIATLTQGSWPEGLGNAPPFTSEQPYLGVLRMRIDGKDRAVVLASDRKLSGRWRIYLDENLNGDLTDDVLFEEGEDFVGAQPFAAGLMGRNDALWLRRPVRLDRSGDTSRAVAVPGRIECMNRLYQRGEVDIPTRAGEAAERKPWLTVLDTDSDGDYTDPEGAIGVWVLNGEKDGVSQPLALLPLEGSSVFAGYRWHVQTDPSGQLVLSGAKEPPVEPLKPGDRLPVIEVETVNGDSMPLAAEGNGYLLIYIWSTWYSACQRDVPSGFIGLHERFGRRGLAMFGVSTDYRKDDLTRYADEYGIAFPQVFDGPDMSRGLTARLGATCSPMAILADATGTVVSVGKIAEELRSFLDANLGPRPGN